MTNAKRFSIIWRNGEYKVTIPNFDGAEVVLASDYDAAIQRAERERDEARESSSVYEEAWHFAANEVSSLRSERDAAVALLRECLPYVCLTDISGRSEKELRCEYPAAAKIIDDLREHIAALVKGKPE